MKTHFLIYAILLSSIFSINAATKPQPKISPYLIMPGEDWQEFTHSIDVEPGSALDLSFLTDAPAGKYGRVVIQRGRFEFKDKPGIQARFYGTNLNFTANYPSHEEAEKLALRLAACGFNAVRFHHHDNGLIDTNANDSLTIAPTQLDKLDYLFYCMKKHGIYVTTDLFVSRILKPAEVNNPGANNRDVKVLAMVSAPIIDNIKEFARRWLTHVNPYTGMTWKDDPALISLSFINENNLGHIWNERPHGKAALEKSFHEWKLAGGKSGENGEVEFNRFITEKQIGNFRIFKDYVSGTLGCQAPATDCNFVSNVFQSMARETFDYVDNHCYWDHPKHESNGLTRHHNKSVIAESCSAPATTIPSRLFGKPFTVTEFNFVCPNIYRSEGSAVMGALAAMQGWDAIYRFAFARSLENATTVSPASRYDAVSDPINLLGERIVAMLFLRGDVREAETSIPFLITPDCHTVFARMDRYPLPYTKLGLIFKLGTVIVRNNNPVLPTGTDFAVAREQITPATTGSIRIYQGDNDLLKKLLDDKVVSKKNYDLENDRTISVTGEIAVDTKANTFNVITPKSECMVLPAGKSGQGRFMAVTDNSTFATIFVSSLDNRALEQSKRMLLLHLTDVKNTENAFSDSSLKLLINDGKLPHLVRKGNAQITFQMNDAARLTVWALSMAGKRLKKISTTIAGSKLSFKTETTGVTGGCMAYEVVRE